MQQPWIVLKSLSDDEVEVPKHFPVAAGIAHHQIPALQGCPLPRQSLNTMALLVQNVLLYKHLPRLNSFQISTMLFGPFRCSCLVSKNFSPSVSYLSNNESWRIALITDTFTLHTSVCHLHWYRQRTQWTRLQYDYSYTSGSPWHPSELSLRVYICISNTFQCQVKFTYFRCISSGRDRSFHSTARSSQRFTSSSLSASNTLDKAARYFPMSFSPPLQSILCSLEIRSEKMWLQTDLGVHAFDDVGCPRVSDFDFAGLFSFAFPAA